MAPIESTPNRRALAGWPNALAALYVVALFLALRVLEDTARVGALAVAGIALAGCIAGRVRGRLSADAEGRKLLLLAGAPADTLLLLGGVLSAWFILGEGKDELVVAAGVLCVVAGAGMTLALELVSGPMRATGVIDNRRVNAAARTAATLVAALAGLMALAYGVEELDVRRDFSFAAPTSPSAATLSMLEAAGCPEAPAPEGSAADGSAADGSAADAPAAGQAKGSARPEVFLFFERGNTALGEVRDYFEGLEQGGARVSTLDSALDPALAKSMKVSKNGTIGFRCGARTESWTLGVDREDAQKKIGKLDEEVRTRLAKITKDAVNVYVTVGHGERSLDQAARGGERTSAKGLKKLIESLNTKVKKLGIADGLSREVPADAALVVVPGPTQAFLPEEATALANYVRGGGSLLLLLDPPLGGSGTVDDAPPDVAGSLEPLLLALGTKVGAAEVLNDKAYVKNTNTAADHAFLYSTSFGSHKSVKTLSGARGKAALLFMSATTVEKRTDAKGAGTDGAKVALIARTPAASWVDVEANRAHDKDKEARAILDLAAAVELPGDAAAGAKDSKGGDGGKDTAKEGRAIVVGDSDVLADMLVAQDANAMFGYEALLWLLRDDAKLGGGVAPEEDVPIRHTRDEDKLWFYATVFFGPLLCLAGGVAFVTLKRRRRGRSGPAPSSPPSPPSPRANAGGAS